MDMEYIRYLMLYSDMKYPYEKAKSDPGLSEGLSSVNRAMRNMKPRTLTQNEANRIRLNEQKAQQNRKDNGNEQENVNERDTE